VLFDSQTVSTKEPREVWHAVSVVLLCFSSWGLHGMTWMFCKNRLMETSKPMGYALESLQGIEYFYIVALTLFVGFFLAQIPIAIQMEYAVLLFFLVLNVVNLWLHREIIILAESQKHILNSATQPKDPTESYKHALAVVFGLAIVVTEVVIYTSAVY